MSQDLLILIIFPLLAGLIVKYVDVLEDDRKNSSLSLKITLGMLYGILLFYTVRRFDVIASLWIGTVIGLILTGKIDSPGHYAGVGLFFVLLLLLGFSNVNFLLLILFALICIIEEILNDYYDKKRIKNRLMSKIISARPLLEITAFIISAATGLWMIWIALLSFDAGYILVANLDKD